VSLRKIGITLVKGTTYFTVAYIVTYAFGMLTSILIPRFLGPADYGLWSLGWSVIVILMLFRGLPGTDDAIIRYVSKYDAENKPRLVRNIVTTSLKLRLLSSGLSCGVAILLANYVANKVFNYPKLAFLLPIFAIGYFTHAFGIESVLNALKKFHYQASLSIFGSILRFFSIAILLIAGFGIMGAAIGQLFQTAFISLLTFFIVFTRFLPSSESHNTENGLNFISTSKKIIAYGLPLSVTGLIGGFSENFMNFMLGLNVEVEVLGYFAVAWAMTTMVVSFAGLASTPLFPIISELDATKDRNKIDRLLSTLFKNLVLFVATVVIFVEFFAPQIVLFIYGWETFESVAIFLRILIILTLPSVFTQLSGTLFRGIGRSDLILKIGVLSTLWMIPATALLISSFGVMGAIAVILANSFGYGLFLWTYFLKKIMGKIPFDLKAIFRLVPTFGITALILLVVRPLILYNLFFLIPSSLLTLLASFILACFTGVVRKNEIDVLQSSLPTNLQRNLKVIFSYFKKMAKE